MRMCWAAFALDAEESGWDDFITSRKSISSSPSLSTSDGSTATTVSSIPPPTPQPESLTVSEDRIWSSEMTEFKPLWEKEVGAVPTEPVIVDVDVDVSMAMEMDMDVEQEVVPPAAPIVTPSEQQEWIKVIDAQIEQNQVQLKEMTVDIEKVEEVIKPAKRYIPTKITAYFPSSPILNIPSYYLPPHMLKQEPKESDEDKRQREALEELAKSLSSVSLRTRTRTQASRPPPIGIGMMMGFKGLRSETPSPKFKGKEVEIQSHLASTKITKRGIISARGGGRVRGAIKRRNSGGRGDMLIVA